MARAECDVRLIRIAVDQGSGEQRVCKRPNFMIQSEQNFAGINVHDVLEPELVLAAFFGNQVTTRGKKKYLGGVGTKITGITKRKFKPNLQRVRVAAENGGSKALWACTQCIRSGAVTKVV